MTTWKEGTDIRQWEKSQNTCNWLLDADIAFYLVHEVEKKRFIYTTSNTVCVVNVPSLQMSFSVVPGAQNWADQQWGQVVFTHESRYSLINDMVLMEREGNSKPRLQHHWKGLVWVGGVFFGVGEVSCLVAILICTSSKRIFNYWCVLYQVLLPHIRLFKGTMRPQFSFIITLHLTIQRGCRRASCSIVRRFVAEICPYGPRTI